MDLTTLPGSEEKKAALKAAIRKAGEGLSKAERLSLYTGAMYGVGELGRGVLAPPTEDLLGPHFLQGRNLVVDFPLR